MRLEPMGAGFDRWSDLLALILEAFDYMKPRIDPPSSALRLTPEILRQKAEAEIVYLAWEGSQLLGCVFLRPEADCLYIGKLAIHPSAQKRGIGKAFLHAAEDCAAQLHLPELRLETRVELLENHAVFARWGFVKTAENAHPGFFRTTSIEMRKVL